MSLIRTTDFVDWEAFLKQESQQIILLLDFEIDAGFSFITAMAQRKIKKGSMSVTIDHSLKIPDVVLNLDHYLEKEKIKLTQITITALFSSRHETTDKYAISARFSPSKVDYNKINKEILKRMELNPEAPRSSHLSAYLSEFFLDTAEALRKKIISHIELSGFFAKLSPYSLNLYLLSGGATSRILQQGGGHNSAGHHPIHPGTIRAAKILQDEDIFKSIPDNIKIHLQKGIHYKFLGFYDESFLSYYKLIETIFKSTKFVDIVASEVFKINNKAIKDTLKSSNQKTMMLFIYQALIQNSTDFTEDDRRKVMDLMLESSQVRNEIAHSSDQTKQSRNLIEFISSLSKLMLNKLIL